MRLGDRFVDLRFVAADGCQDGQVADVRDRVRISDRIIQKFDGKDAADRHHCAHDGSQQGVHQHLGSDWVLRWGGGLHLDETGGGLRLCQADLLVTGEHGGINLAVLGQAGFEAIDLSLVELPGLLFQGCGRDWLSIFASRFELFDIVLNENIQRLGVFFDLHFQVTELRLQVLLRRKVLGFLHVLNFFGENAHQFVGYIGCQEGIVVFHQQLQQLRVADCVNLYLEFDIAFLHPHPLAHLIHERFFGEHFGVSFGQLLVGQVDRGVVAGLGRRCFVDEDGRFSLVDGCL